NGFDADQARYRNIVGNRISATHGRMPDGSIYRAHSFTDATMDLPFDRDYDSSQATNLSPDRKRGTIARMARWDRWITDSGWYWQLYNAEAGNESNLVGIFA